MTPIIAGLLTCLKVDVNKGLSSKDGTDLHSRQAAFGANKTPPPKTVTFWELVVDSFKDRVLQILLMGAFITLIVGMVQDPSTGWHEGISIVITVGIVVGCKCGNDYWKEKKFQAILAKAAQKKCKVSLVLYREEASEANRVYHHCLLSFGLFKMACGG